MVSHAAKLSLLAEFLKVCCLHPPRARITSFHLFFFSIEEEWPHPLVWAWGKNENTMLEKPFWHVLRLELGNWTKKWTTDHCVNNSKQAKHSWEITWDNKIAEARSRYPSQKNKNQCEDEFLLPIWCFSFDEYGNFWMIHIYIYTNPPISQGFIVGQFLLW